MGRVAVRLPNWLGDVVMASPFLRELRDRESYVVLVGKAKFREIIPQNLYDEFVEYQGIFRTARILKGIKIHRFFILPNSFGSALLSLLSGSEERIGYSMEGRDFFLTHPIERPSRVMDMPSYYLELMARYYGTGKPSFGGFSVSFKPFHLSLKRFAVFIHGASFGPSKMWPLGYFSELADLIHHYYGISIVIPPGPGEEERAFKISQGKRYIKVLAEPVLSLGELAFLIKNSLFVVTNDTGPRHLGEAFGIPTFVLMGPTSPAYTDYPSRNTVVIRKPVPCSPCHRKVCPKNLECLRSITPMEVFNTIRVHLGNSLTHP